MSNVNNDFNDFIKNELDYSFKRKVRRIFFTEDEIVFYMINFYKDHKNFKMIKVFDFIDLPEDWKVVKSYYSAEVNGWYFHIYSNEFDEVKIGEIPPEILPEVKVIDIKYLFNEGGENV
jgi:hypothetical protein